MPSRNYEIPLLPKQGILVLVIILFAASIDTQDNGQEPYTSPKTIKLEDKIRRELMKDNYDYLPSKEALHSARAEEDASPTVNGEEFARIEADYEQKDDRRDEYNTGPKLLATADDADIMIPRTPDTSTLINYKNEVKPNLGSIVSRKDLLYYIDDKRMRRADHINENDVNETSDISAIEFDDIIDATTPDVKYKMIKVKEEEPTRRKSSYRRFIQESNREGYSIIRLDDQPFPAFQLPRSRRQYAGSSERGASGTLPDQGSSGWQQ